MNHIIRNIGLLSFTFLTAILSSCASADHSPEIRLGSNRALKTPEALAERPKIIAFGDSLTAGFGLTERESYPYLLQERLNADGYDYEVINAGVSGDTSLGGLERIDWVLDRRNTKGGESNWAAKDWRRVDRVGGRKRTAGQTVARAGAKTLTLLHSGKSA